MELLLPSRTHLNEAKKVRKQLLGNESLYVESIGKVDLANLVPNPEIEKRGRTVLRLILGATEQMPFRSLGYIDSAVRTAKALGDIDQVQIIHANSVGERINGISKLTSDKTAKHLADASMEITAMTGGENFSILHGIDTTLDTERFESLARQALESDPAIAEKLTQRGAKHGGDALAYTAVHFAFQDHDNLEIQSLFADTPPQIEADRIISIGCQQEKTFYLARMAMRGVAADGDNMIEHTAQIFTKHVVPPYYFARGGEPSLAEGMDPEFYGLLEPDAHQRLEQVDDLAARRDIKHFITVNNLQENVNE